MRALLTATMFMVAAMLFAALAVPPAFAQAGPAAGAAAPASSAAAPPAPGGSAASAAPDAKKEESRVHFDKALGLFEEQAWDAALAEFLRSREIFATRAATTNAAVCLRKLHRFDEALDMFEALLKEFPNLPANDKASAERERAELKGLVGAIEIRSSEPDASAVVDGRDRGVAHPGQSIRVSAGSHVVKVYKEGFTPFESRVEVSGGQTAVVEAKLGALTQSGRLRVSEQGGQSLDVLVDGVVVGKTPWDGQLALGEHTVQLRGAGDLGTQPVSAPIELNHTSVLTLQAEELTASLRVSPTPIGGTVAIDGVVVGRGVWTGKLRAGQHRVEVAAEGFVPVTRQVKIDKGKQESMAVELERDPNSALWRAQNPSRFTIELDGGLAIAPSFGGDIASTTCTGTCAANLGLGGLFLGRIGYQLGSGLGFSLNAGYLTATQKVTDRPTVDTPRGSTPNDGIAADTLKLSGILVGADAAFHRGAKVPLTFGLGVGVLIGTLNDHRTGDFTTSPPLPPIPTTRIKQAYTVDLSTSASAKYLYLDPKVRIGVRLGDHLEVNAGIDAMIFVALTQPKWDDSKSVTAGGVGGDGYAYFDAQTLAGKTVVVLSPGLGARYEF